MPTTTGVITRLGKRYNDGVQHLSIEVKKEDAGCLPYEIGKRVNIELLVQGKKYAAGLRATERNKTVWISPDLRDSNEDKVRLADLFQDYATRQKVTIKVTGNQLEVI